MLLRLPAAAAGMLALFFAAPLVRAGSLQRLKWDQLSTIVGKTVSVVMPDAAIISGTATAVEADALLVRVAKTTNVKTCPRGSACRVPRATLRGMEMRTKTSRYRIIGTTAGLVAGLAGGAVAVLAIGGSAKNNNKAAAAGAGIVGVFFASGYLVGNAYDRRSTTIEIIPD
jgi:hypothetical protein